jgi:hypothetical protein
MNNIITKLQELPARPSSTAGRAPGTTVPTPEIEYAAHPDMIRSVTRCQIMQRRYRIDPGALPMAGRQGEDVHAARRVHGVAA